MDEEDQKRKDAIIVGGCELMNSVRDKEMFGDDDEGAEEVADALIDAVLCVVAQLEIKAAESPAFRRLARKLDEWPTRVSAYKNQWGVDPDFIASLGLGEDYPFRLGPEPGKRGWKRDTGIFSAVKPFSEQMYEEMQRGELEIEMLSSGSEASVTAWTDEIVMRITRDENWADHKIFEEVKKTARSQVDAEERKSDSGAVLLTRLRERVKRALRQLAK